jgi:hypothetical protein
MGIVVRRIGWAGLLISMSALPAAAQPELDPALDRCSGGTRERLVFLETHLDGEQRYAYWWWQGWNGVYVGGMAIQSVRAGFEGDDGEQADLVVSAVKAGIGLTRNLLRPPPAKEGTRELRGLSTATERDCEQRLARAEEILRRNAAAARRERRSWIPHAANLGLNLAGALIVTQGFDEASGWGSAALGFAVGEARIWSYPWRAGGALAEYERRFPASGLPPSPQTSLQVEPWGSGVQVVLRY